MNIGEHASRTIGALGILLCVLLMSTGRAEAQSPDSLRSGKRLLYVGIINADCFPDTVWGTHDEEFNALPTLIVWGRPEPAVERAAERDRAKRDSLDACEGRVPKGRKHRFTSFIYPDFERFSGSISFVNLNGDAYTDLFLTLWGKVPAGNSKRDTVRRLVLFGQHGLDSLPTLNLKETGRFQQTPFFALDLRVGAEIDRPAKRDLSRRTSYELLPLDFRVDEEGGPRPGTGGDEVAGRGLRVHPNPASGTADVRATGLEEGLWQVEVVATNGETVLRGEVRVPASGTLLGTLDLSELPSGYYAVRVTQNGREAAVYPIVVAR